MMILYKAGSTKQKRKEEKQDLLAVPVHVGDSWMQ